MDNDLPLSKRASSAIRKRNSRSMKDSDQGPEYFELFHFYEHTMLHLVACGHSSWACALDARWSKSSMTDTACEF